MQNGKSLQTEASEQRKGAGFCQPHQAPAELHSGKCPAAWELLPHSAEGFVGKARSQAVPGVARTVLEQENGVVRDLWRPPAQP